MKINDYPYGRITKTLRKACGWINKNKTKVIKSYIQFGDGKEDKDLTFLTIDYPDYFDMPRSISSRLSNDEVDWLQDEFEYIKEDFRKKHKL